MKFTFKKEPQTTGLAGVGEPWPDTQIKHDRKQVGIIAAPNWMIEDHKWGIRLAVETPGEGCGWKWVRITTRFDDEPQARQWIKDNTERIAKTFTLHHFDSEE